MYPAFGASSIFARLDWSHRFLYSGMDMKGIIVAAGYGTRFLPVTKTIPKEMLPLLDKPSIAFIIEEFITSGIEEILIISSRRKKSLEDYLDREMELEALFTREGNREALELVRPYPAHFTIVRQTEMLGTGHALLLARGFAAGEPVVVAYPDDIHFGDEPLTAQLTERYRETGKTVLATLFDPPELNRYGVLSLDEEGTGVTDIVEKPAPGTEPSREASIGRYLYTPEFFSLLQEGWEKHLKSKRTGEYYHTYALKRLMTMGKVTYCRTRGERLDTGTPAGYLRAILRYAARDGRYASVLQEEAARLKDVL